MTRKGVEGPTPERVALAAKVRALRNDDLTHREIAERLNISRSYAAQLDTDPDGKQARQRKDSYAGTCIRCGTATSGSAGPNKAPILCADCSIDDMRKSAIWDRETVVDAIQRFAAVHGRAPTADEWRVADPENGYPAAACVYGSTTTKWGTTHRRPFPKWADAIEAAGFPRPTSGRRTQKEKNMADPQKRFGYTVLRENDDGTWEVIEQNTTTNVSVALNHALDGHEPVGRWVAVPGKFWRPRSLKAKQIYEFVEE